MLQPDDRTMDTCLAVMAGTLSPEEVAVDELCRERLGSNSCDARRPAAVGFVPKLLDGAIDAVQVGLVNFDETPKAHLLYE